MIEEEINKANFMVNEDVSELCKHLIESILVPLPDPKKETTAKEGEEVQEMAIIEKEERRRATLQ